MGILLPGRLSFSWNFSVTDDNYKLYQPTKQPTKLFLSTSFQFLHHIIPGPNNPLRVRNELNEFYFEWYDY